MLRSVRQQVASVQWPVASSGRWVAGLLGTAVRKAVLLATGHWPLATFLLATGHWTLATSSGAIFPDQIGGFTKSAPKAVSVADQALYNEYGLLASEQAEYSKADQKNGDLHFTATG